MKATLAGLALTTAAFAAHAEPPIVDKDAQTVTWTTTVPNEKDSRDARSYQILNCRFGTLSHRTSDYRGGVAVVDVGVPNGTRTENVRKTCKAHGLTPEF